MARDNRKDNRQKGKEAGNENKAPDGTDFSDLLDVGNEDIEEEDAIEIEKEGNEEDETAEDAAKREAEAKAKTDANDVKTKGEADGAKAKEGELNADGTPKEKVAGEGEETEEEKAAKKLAEEAKAKEPTPQEKEAEAARVAAEAKRLKDEEDAKAAAKKAEETPKTLTDEEAAELFGDWRATTETLLAEHVYKLTEEDVAQLNENPAAYIPKAMARVYLDTISASFQQFVNYLPRMVYQVLDAREKNVGQESTFFGAWPKLNTDAGKETVRRLGMAYRQANPSASTEQWINEVGAQAMVALRLVPDNAANGTAKTEEELAKEVEKPFKPATGTETRTPEKEKETNPFASMAKEFGMEMEAEEIDGN